MEKKNKHKATAPKSKAPKYILIGLSVLALGAGAAYLGLKIYRNHKRVNGSDNLDTSGSASGSASGKASGGSSRSVVWRDDSFPLSVGSSGPKVVQLQAKLNNKYKAGLVTDGLFGPLTHDAVLMAGFRVPVDQATFEKITDGEATLVFDPRSVANRLLKFSLQKDLNATLVSLGEMKSVDHYKTVNFYFQILTLANTDIGARRTVVTHLLSHAFVSESKENKTLITNEFKRMGLVERDGKWALAGLENLNNLVTVRDTMVRDLKGNRIRVKKGTLLGKELYSSGPLTTFIAVDGTKGLVPATHVKYYKN